SVRVRKYPTRGDDRTGRNSFRLERPCRTGMMGHLTGGWQMRTAIRVVALIVLSCSSWLSAAEEHATLIRAQSLIDGVSAQPRRNQDILVRGNRIVEVSPTGSHAPPAGVEVIDLGGATVLPGLIDTHTHIFLQGEVAAAGGYDVQLLK